MLILLRQDGILPRQVLIHFGQDIQDLHRLFLLGIRLPELEQFALPERLTLLFERVHTGLEPLDVVRELLQPRRHVWPRGQVLGPCDHHIQPGKAVVVVVVGLCHASPPSPLTRLCGAAGAWLGARWDASPLLPDAPSPANNRCSPRAAGPALRDGQYGWS